MQDALDRIERLDPALNSFITVRAEEALAEADALGGSVSGPLHGVPVGGEGRDRRRGHADDGGLEGAGGQRPGDGRDCRAAPAPRGRDRRRQAQHARVRLRRLDDERRLRRCPQPVGHRADLRRLERRERRGRRGRPRAGRARDRHRGLDPHPRGVLRRHGDPADDGPRPEPRRHSGVVDVRHRRPARAHGGGLRAPARRDRRATIPTTHRRRPPRPSRASKGSTVASRASGSVSSRTSSTRCRSTRASQRVVETALEELARLGARVERVDARFLRRAEVVQQLVMLPEAAEAHLPWLRTRLADYGPDVRARLLAGLLLPSSAPITGQRARRALADEARPLFDRFDLLAAPEMPIVAPRIGEDPVEVGGQTMPLPARADPLQLALELPRPADGERPVRLRRRPSGRARADRAPARGGDRPPRRARLPAGDRLARAAAAGCRLTPRGAPSYTQCTPPSKGRTADVRADQGRPHRHRGRRLRRGRLHRGRPRRAARRLARRQRGADDRRERQDRDAGRDRSAHAHRDVLRRHDDVRRLHVRHDGRRVRRHDDADRLLHPGARHDVRRGARGLPREAHALSAA